MIIKERVYESQMVERKIMISDEVHGCDECRKEIDRDKEDGSLRMTVFYQNNKDSSYLHFCSWKCVLNHLPKIECDYFIDLPYVSFDHRKDSNTGVHALLKALGKY